MSEQKNTYLVITPFFPSYENHNGSYVFDQIKEIKKQTSFNIEIIKVVSLFSSEKDYEFQGFQVKIFKTFDFPFFIFPGAFSFINKKRIVSFLKFKTIKNIAFVHAHVTYPCAYLANSISSKLKIKTFIQHHGLDVLQLLNGRNYFLRKIWKKYFIRKSISQLNNIDVNIGVSNKVLNELQQFDSYNPISEYVLYNGVDISKFFPKKRQESNSFKIGCVANFWKIKDHILLIKAVEILAAEGLDIKLRLIGTGPTFSKCFNYVKNNNLQQSITFEKERSHEGLNDFYNEIDLFVLPSYYEALGCVYLESWATNTPFIAVQGQGIAELAPDKKNMLFEKKNLNSLIEKIKYFTKNKIQIKFDENLKIENTISDFLKLEQFKSND
ncbi:MAG: glycosyltransferase family 4 protein [Flavobacteriales bacterium]|nr:glycosyltransferase family 4 protein [Flavobacteriales bacterium]